MAHKTNSAVDLCSCNSESQPIYIYIYILMRQCAYTGHHHPQQQSNIQFSLQPCGRVSKRLSVAEYLAQHFVLRPMASQRGPSRHWRLCGGNSRTSLHRSSSDFQPPPTCLSTSLHLNIIVQYFLVAATFNCSLFLPELSSFTQLGVF